MKNAVLKFGSVALVAKSGKEYAKPDDVIDQSELEMSGKVRHSTLSALRQRARDQGCSIKTTDGEYINTGWLDDNMDSIISEMIIRDREGEGAPRTMERREIKRLKAHIERLQIENMDLVGENFKGEDAIAELTDLKAWCWDNRQQFK